MGQGESGFDPEVGVTKSSSGSFGTPIQYSLGSDFRNIFGLRIQSVKLGRTSPAQYPVLPAGGSVTTNAISSYFPDVERPVLETIGYYFGRIDPWHVQSDQLPGHIDFTPANTTPVFIGAVGQSMEFSGWAKQRIVNGDPNKFAYREEYFDKAYKLDTSGNPANETGVLSEYGEFFPTEPGRVILTTKPDPDQGGIQGTCLVQVIKLQFDLNHDGEMDLAYSGPDNTTPARPLRFWTNGDHDQPASSSEPDRDLERLGAPDHSYGRIRCPRNLEDFARLWIVGVPDLPPIQGYTATLSWRSVHGNPRINLYYANAQDGGTGYLTDTNAAQDQFIQTFFNGQLVTDYARSVAQIAPGTEYPLPIQPRSGHLLQEYYLFEGAGIGGGELVLSIRRNGTVIAESVQWIELDYVWKMFERAAITNVQQYWPEMVEQARTSGFHLMHTPAPDASETKQVAVFVHGWRMTEWGALNFAETMFKRLYWQGFQGRFAALRWPTRSSETEILPGLDLATFNRSEQIAFKSGTGTASYFNDLRRRFPEHTIRMSEIIS